MEQDLSLPDPFWDISRQKGKRIVPVVITNYPLYAGFNENGIPVVDINLFLNILTNSPLIRQAISSEGATTVNEIRYYENEQEFALNFTEILLNPMPIKNLRKKLQIKTEVIPMMSESEVCFVEERYYINPSI